jgi:hypothetical protein
LEQLNLKKLAAAVEGEGCASCQPVLSFWTGPKKKVPKKKPRLPFHCEIKLTQFSSSSKEANLRLRKVPNPNNTLGNNEKENQHKGWKGDPKFVTPAK